MLNFKIRGHNSPNQSATNLQNLEVSNIIHVVVYEKSWEVLNVNYRLPGKEQYLLWLSSYLTWSENILLQGSNTECTKELKIIYSNKVNPKTLQHCWKGHVLKQIDQLYFTCNFICLLGSLLGQFHTFFYETVCLFLCYPSMLYKPFYGCLVRSSDHNLCTSLYKTGKKEVIYI